MSLIVLFVVLTSFHEFRVIFEFIVRILVDNFDADDSYDL